jgi:hypothetical protein
LALLGLLDYFWGYSPQYYLKFYLPLSLGQY